jgi:hypothetical protein
MGWAEVRWPGMGKPGGQDVNDNAVKLLTGFIAGALAVLVFHQLTYLGLQQAGMVTSPPWRMNPVPPYGVPTILNQVFWGGLWGAAFGLLFGQLPGRGWQKGIIFGMIGPMLLGSWLVVALLKGQPVMAGFVPPRMLVGFLLNGIAFGLGLGLLYPALRGLLRREA